MGFFGVFLFLVSKDVFGIYVGGTTGSGSAEAVASHRKNMHAGIQMCHIEHAK